MTSSCKHVPTSNIGCHYTDGHEEVALPPSVQIQIYLPDHSSTFSSVCSCPAPTSFFLFRSVFASSFLISLIHLFLLSLASVSSFFCAFCSLFFFYFSLIVVSFWRFLSFYSLSCLCFYSFNFSCPFLFVYSLVPFFRFSFIPSLLIYFLFLFHLPFCFDPSYFCIF
jgi:hypothetical protein